MTESDPRPNLRSLPGGTFVLRRLRPGVLIASAVLTLSALVPAPAAAAIPTLNAIRVQDGLVIPWDLAFAPTGQMIVTERPGRVRVYASGKINAPLVATSTISRVDAEGEAGVMGIAIAQA